MNHKIECPNKNKRVTLIVGKPQKMGMSMLAYNLADKIIEEIEQRKDGIKRKEGK